MSALSRSAAGAAYSHRLSTLSRSAAGAAYSHRFSALSRSAVGAAYSRRFSALSRSAVGAAYSHRFSALSRSAVGAAYSHRFSALSRSAVGAAYSHRFSALSRSAAGAAYSHRLSALSRSAAGAAYSHRLSALSRSAAGAAYSHRLSALSRSAAGTAYSHRLSALSRSAAGIANSPKLTSLLGHKLSETLAPLREQAQFEDTGWFPHSTFPRDLLNSHGFDACSGGNILAYYRDNWTKVRQAIEKELSAYHVDRDAKEAVRQALIAHEEGLYRLVPTALFVEIERAVRVNLCDDEIGTISVKKRLVDMVGQLPLSALPDGILGFVGFSQLNHHLYENIRTVDARNRFLDASIPNRHAVIHGLVIYSSEKSSLNAIFVAMYVFRVLTLLAR